MPSVYVSGLSNGRGYYFTVYAVNAQGPGTAVQAGPFQSAADPAPPKAPTVRAVPSASGETADLVVSWPEVAPNGPSPVTYNVYRNNSAYAGCLQVSVRSCTVPQVPYDGATHTFAVQAVQGSYRSDVGPATSWKAVTLPARWGDWSWDATGRDREVEIRFTVPDSHGSTSEVSIIVDGDSAWKGELEGIRTRTISVGDNDEDHVVKLRVCNESEACTDSASQQVRAYGPLMPWHIEGISAEYDGTRVRWRVSVDTNGASARVRIGSSDRPDQTFVLSSLDKATVVSDFRDLGFSATENLTVTLEDPARGRGPVTKHDVATTPDAPPAAVKVGRGDRCSDDPDSPLPRCNEDGQGVDCVDSSCGFVTLQTTGFFSPVTCTVTSQGGDVDATLAPIPDGATTQTKLYFGSPGSWVKAACHNAGDTRTAADRYTWPN